MTTTTLTTTRHTARTWFVTGATSGIGHELTRAVLERGGSVVALARRTDALAPLALAHGDRLLAVAADVRRPSDVERAVQEGLTAFGRIDVVANNAGYGLFGAVEEASDEQARAIFDTNVHGVLNVLRATLPVLRAQRNGHVLQGSSYYGQVAHAGVGLLAATKFAVEGLTEALVAELAPLDINVTLVEPGPTATAFLTNLDLTPTAEDYDQTVRVVQQAIADLPPSAATDPTRVAAAVLDVVDSVHPPLRLVTGSYAVDEIRRTLEARLAELEEWAPTSRNVDAVPVG